MVTTSSMHQPRLRALHRCTQLPESSKQSHRRHYHPHFMDKEMGLEVGKTYDSRPREGRDWDSLILMFQPRGEPCFPQKRGLSCTSHILIMHFLEAFCLTPRSK